MVLEVLAMAITFQKEIKAIQRKGRTAKMGLPRWHSSKESACSAGNSGDAGSIPREGSSPGVGNGNPVFLPGKFHGQRILAGYSPWGHKETQLSD